MRHDQRGFLEAMIGDGRPLIAVSRLCLGLFGIFQALSPPRNYFLGFVSLSRVGRFADS